MRRDYTSAHLNTAYSMPIGVKKRNRTRTDAELIAIYCIAARIGTPVGNSVQVLISTGQRRRDGAVRGAMQAAKGQPTLISVTTWAKVSPKTVQAVLREIQKAKLLPVLDPKTNESRDCVR